MRGRNERDRTLLLPGQLICLDYETLYIDTTFFDELS